MMSHSKDNADLSVDQKVLSLFKKLAELSIAYREVINRDEPFEVAKRIKVEMKEVEREIKILQENITTAN